MTALILSAALVTLQPLVSEEVLELSVQNEVDHALSRAPAEAWTAATNVAPVVAVASTNDVRGACTYACACAATSAPVVAPPADVFGTNGLSATAIALKLISAQGPDGRWRVGTNDVTVTALRILRTLSESNEEEGNEQ